jgi:putative membrane protein
MLVTVWLLILVAGIVHVVVGAFEAFLIARPFVYAGVFGVPAADIPAIRLWTFGLGFYNVFLGLGAFLSVALWAGGQEVAGRTLAIYLLTFMLLSAVVLLVAERVAAGRGRGKSLGGALGQGAVPLLALIGIALV